MKVCQIKVVMLSLVLQMLATAPVAEAGMENVRFALHYKPKFVPSKTMSLCDNASTSTEEPNYSPNYTNTPCSLYQYHAPLGPGQVYVVIGNAGLEGVAAASFGVTYSGSAGQGIDPAFVTWTSCTNGLAFPNSDGVHGDFPQPGGGLRITWGLPEGCQTEIIEPYGVHAVAGVFYVYAYSGALLRLTLNYNIAHGPEAAVADCAGRETDLVAMYGPANAEWFMGGVGFGNVLGCNPCGEPCPWGNVPVSPTSWGRLKRRY